MPNVEITIKITSTITDEEYDQFLEDTNGGYCECGRRIQFDPTDPDYMLCHRCKVKLDEYRREQRAMLALMTMYQNNRRAHNRQSRTATTAYNGIDMNGRPMTVYRAEDLPDFTGGQPANVPSYAAFKRGPIHGYGRNGNSTARFVHRIPVTH